MNSQVWTLPRARLLVLLAIMAYATLPTSESFCQSTTLSFKISNSSDDAEERLSNGNVSLNSSDIELIKDGSRDQVIGLRFNNIPIEQGTVIQNAFIRFETDETDSETTHLTFNAQDVDNATTFTNTSYNISTRTLTSATVNWNFVPPWNTVNEKYDTPDIKSIIQEIIDRPGWVAGNSIAVIVNGSGQRTAESYNGEQDNAPTLFLTFEGEFESCYTIRQNNNGSLYSWYQTGGNSYIGNLGVSEVETMTMNGECGEVYVANNGDFGQVDLNTGAYTFNNALGVIRNPIHGNHTVNDVDGMAIDNLSGYIFASERLGGSNDLLFLIDPLTGFVVPNAFGPGTDYVPVPGALQDLDDLAFNPCTHELYGLSTVSSSTSINDVIVVIDIQTGVATPLVTLPECDSEGMTFNNDCELFVSVGASGCINEGAIFEVDLSNGNLTEITDIGGDVEAVVCCVDAPDPAPLSCTAEQISPMCQDGADIEVFPSGGTGGYIYSWSNGSSDKVQYGLPNGNYMVTVTDYSGTTTICNVETESYNPLCNIIENEPDCENTGTGSATATGYNSVAPYTYLWDNGDTTPTSLTLTAGTHVVTVTDNEGCTTTCEIEISHEEVCCKIIYTNGFLRYNRQKD